MVTTFLGRKLTKKILRKKVDKEKSFITNHHKLTNSQTYKLTNLQTHKLTNSQIAP